MARLEPGQTYSWPFFTFKFDDKFYNFNVQYCKGNITAKFFFKSIYP